MLFIEETLEMDDSDGIFGVEMQAIWLPCKVKEIHQQPIQKAPGQRSQIHNFCEYIRTSIQLCGTCIQ